MLRWGDVAAVRCTLLVILLGCCPLATAPDSFRIAYAEHQATSACGAGSCGAATKAQNVAVLVRYAAQAAALGAQLIVFPECECTPTCMMLLHTNMPRRQIWAIPPSPPGPSPLSPRPRRHHRLQRPGCKLLDLGRLR